MWRRLLSIVGVGTPNSKRPCSILAGRKTDTKNKVFIGSMLQQLLRPVGINSARFARFSTIFLAISSNYTSQAFLHS
jgi:hypothetical protein